MGRDRERKRENNIIVEDVATFTVQLREIPEREIERERGRRGLVNVRVYTAEELARSRDKCARWIV